MSEYGVIMQSNNKQTINERTTELRKTKAKRVLLVGVF